MKDLLGLHVILTIRTLSYRQWEVTETFKKGKNSRGFYSVDRILWKLYG